ncbi:kinase family protein [Corchorus olitorius]|uniref:Kinase family protein n=1 Tax=Corchorus olitorius TaxID=93759 RepID=A0A1R3KCI7_9ROSI|nr:kinase family protein [Corchorus olitorius]
MRERHSPANSSNQPFVCRAQRAPLVSQEDEIDASSPHLIHPQQFSLDMKINMVEIWGHYWTHRDLKPPLWMMFPENFYLHVGKVLESARKSGPVNVQGRLLHNKDNDLSNGRVAPKVYERRTRTRKGHQSISGNVDNFMEL